MGSSVRVRMECGRRSGSLAVILRQGLQVIVAVLGFSTNSATEKYSTLSALSQQVGIPVADWLQAYPGN